MNAFQNSNFANMTSRFFTSNPLGSRLRGPGQQNDVPASELYEQLKVGSVDRYVTSPALSPDGRLLACIVAEQNSYPKAIQITLDADGVPVDGSERDVVLPSVGAVRKVLYSPNGRWLACEFAPDGGDREQIWFVTTDPDDPNAYELNTGAHATVELISWDHHTMVVSAYAPDGTVEGQLIDPMTGDRTVIDRRVGGALMHSREGVSLFRVGSRGNRELLFIRPDGSWSPLLPRDTGSTTDDGHVLQTSRSLYGTAAAHPAYSPDETVLLVRSDHSSDRARLLEVIRTDKDTRTRTLAEREDAELDSFSVSTDGSTVALVWNSDGYCDLEVIDITGKQPVQIAEPELPAVIAKNPSLNADGTRLAVGVSGPEFPHSVMVYDVSRQDWAGEGFGITASAVGEVANPEIEEEDTPVDQRGRTILSAWGRAHVIPERLSYTARDGLELTGWLYRAVGHPADQSAPTVVYFHGGPEGQSRPNYNNVLRKLALSGYHVFQPNIRGSVGRGRAFSQADDRYSRFSSIDDAEDTLDFLIAEGLAREGSNIIAGRSYGGYMVHASLTRHPGRWQGGIAACGMSDLLTFYRDTEPWIAAAAHPKYGHPSLDRELLQQASPIHWLNRVQVPVLFIHGQLDNNVPVSEAYQANGVLAAQGVDTDFLLFDDEGHEFEKLSNRGAMARTVLEFCEKTISHARAPRRE